MFCVKNQYQNVCSLLFGTSTISTISLWENNYILSKKEEEDIVFHPSGCFPLKLKLIFVCQPYIKLCFLYSKTSLKSSFPYIW